MAVNPPPARVIGPGGLFSGGSSDQALWDSLINRPEFSIPIPATAASQKLFNGACIIDGWQLRETTGTAPALVEFIDGQDATGVVIGEANISAPITGQAGSTDTDVDASAQGAASAITATLPGVAGQTTFITGFEITGLGATGASGITVTVTGILGGTKSYVVPILAGATTGIVPFFVEFSRPIPASAVNTAIVVNVPSFGAGNTQSNVTAHGFQRLVGATGASAAQTAGGPNGVTFVLIRSGIFMRVIAGSVTGAIWIKA